MTTLISVYSKDRCVGRCDAKCYDAEHDDCACVCGGINHGKGIEAAKENVRLYHDEMIESYVNLLELADYETLVNVTVVNQMSLPLTSRLNRSG